MANTTTPKRKIAPGLWQLQMDLYEIRVRSICPRTGKRIAKWQRFHGTRAEALRQRELLRVELEAGDARRAREKLGDYATSWLKTRLERNDLAPSTARRYAEALDLHLLPALGEVFVDALTPRSIDTEVAKWARAYEPETVNGWLRVLRTVLAAALRDGLVVQNAAMQVRSVRSRVDDDRDTDDDDSNALSPEELNAYLAAWRELYRDDFPLVALLAVTGLRWGEATAITWAEVARAESQGVLRVRRSHVRGAVRGTTKSGRKRMIPFPAELADLLRKHRGRLEAEEHPGLEAGWVFANSAGNPWANGAFSKKHRVVLTHAKIPKRFTIHGLRRTATDLLRRASVDPVLGKLIIGHSTDRMREHYSSIGADEAARVGRGMIELIPTLLLN